jgi:sigma-E factor negative regulatory protein RseC
MEKLIEGVVIENSGGAAKVRISVHSDCENCGACPGSDAMILDAVDEIGTETGQRVLMKSKENNMLLAAFLVYIFPLLAVGCGIFLGYYLSSRLMMSSALLMTLGGLIFALAAIFIVKRLDRSLESEKPVIVRAIK